MLASASTKELGAWHTGMRRFLYVRAFGKYTHPSMPCIWFLVDSYTGMSKKGNHTAVAILEKGRIGDVWVPLQNEPSSYEPAVLSLGGE